MTVTTVALAPLCRVVDCDETLRPGPLFFLFCSFLAPKGSLTVECPRTEESEDRSLSPKEDLENTSQDPLFFPFLGSFEYYGQKEVQIEGRGSVDNGGRTVPGAGNEQPRTDPNEIDTAVAFVKKYERIKVLPGHPGSVLKSTTLSLV